MDHEFPHEQTEQPRERTAATSRGQRRLVRPSAFALLSVLSAQTASATEPVVPPAPVTAEEAAAADLLTFGSDEAWTASDWKQSAYGSTSFRAAYGADIVVEVAVPGRDENVPVPVRFRAFERAGTVGRVLDFPLCVDQACDVRERIRVKTGTDDAPAPAVVRHLPLSTGSIMVVDDEGRAISLLETVHSGDWLRIALIGDEPLVIPHASVLLSVDPRVAMQAMPGIAPLATDRALDDEPSLVHAFLALSVAPGTPLSAPLVVELRRALHAGAVVIGDATLRTLLVTSRDDAASKESVLSGKAPLARVGRPIAPSSTLVSPSGQALRTGPRGPLPVVAWDDHGGLFLERSPSATGEDIVDALLAERSDLAGGRAVLARQPYGDTRGVSSAVTLVARTLPPAASWIFAGVFALVVAFLVVRHRGRRARRAFLFEAAALSLVCVAAILVVAKQRAAERTTSEVTVWTERPGASLVTETHVRAARPSTTGETVAVPVEIGRVGVPEVRGNTVETPVPLVRAVDGSFAVESSPDTALVVTTTRLVPKPGAITVARDESGVPTAITNATGMAFDEVRVQTGHEVKMARDVGAGARVDLVPYVYGEHTTEADTPAVAAARRLSQDLTNRTSYASSQRPSSISIVAVGHTGDHVFGYEVMP